MALARVALPLSAYHRRSLSPVPKSTFCSNKELGAINGHIEEIYAGHDVVKAYNGENAASKTFEVINNRLYTCSLEISVYVWPDDANHELHR